MHLMAGADNAIEITSSDGEARFTSFADAVVDDYGSCTVPGKLLADISKYFAGEQISISREGSEFSIVSGRSRFSLPAGDADEYPSWAEPPPVFLTLDGDELAAAIRKVLPSLGEFPVALSAVRLELRDDVLDLVTTDRVRLTVVSLPVTRVNFQGQIPPVLLPGGHAGLLARSSLEGPAGLGWSEDIMFAAHAEGQMTVRLIAEQYPKWRFILDKQPPYAGITSDTKELIRATRMAQLAAGPDNKISWIFGKHEIAVNAEREGRNCAEYVPSTYEGPGNTFLLGAQHVLDGLAGMGETTEMAFTQAPAPLFLRSGNCTYMIQPRREL
jgi:DNA polymerase-3 subunit beta